MQLTIEKNKLFNQPQTIQIDRSVLTLIGKNGCGKSSILESVFEKYIDSEYRIICFTSGQNELFSEVFNRHKKRKARAYTVQGIESEGALTSYYFNADWVRTLVFFATALKKEGQVRRYLFEHNYIDQDESLNDTTTELDIKIRMRKRYMDQIKWELKEEEKPDYDHSKWQLKNSGFNRAFETLLRSFKIPFDTETVNYITKRGIGLKAHKVKRSFISDDVNDIFTFLSIAAHRDQNLDIWDTKLFFKDGIEFQQLSDGEYQLLSIYAMIDLFDSERNIFLLDEIDSHLYYENIGRLWNVLNNIQGKVLATSHISESILSNPFENIKLVTKGKMESELTLNELAKRVSNLTGKDNYELHLTSRVINVALVEDESDWIIFWKLARRMIGAEVDDIFKRIVPFKRSSSFKTQNEIFGKSKLIVVDEFRKEYANKPKLTRNFILMCDKDHLPQPSISDRLEVQINNEFKDCRSFQNIQTKLYSWKRMEIENYLISISMLELKGKIQDLRDTFPHLNLQRGNNLDGFNDIRDFDSKEFIHPLYKDPQLNETKLDEIIALIPPSEISADIEMMYRQIEEQVNRQ